MNLFAELGCAASLSYTLGILRGGKIVHEAAARPHMITDTGLDKIAQSGSRWLAQLEKCIVGTGGLAVRRDDGLVSFTQAGFTLTADAPFFVAGDVGRLFKWGAGDAGDEVYITAFTDSLNVTVSVSAAVAVPSVGTVWYVNTAAIVSPVAGVTWTKQASGNGSVFNVVGDTCTVTHTTINVSSVFAAPATISELAINDSTVNANVFDRDLVSPPVAVLAGDQLVITIQLINKYSSVTPVAVGNVATGYDSSGNFQIESLGASGGGGMAVFNANGSISASAGIEPTDSGYLLALTELFALQPFNATVLPSSASVFAAYLNSAYGTGNRYIDLEATFSISQGNGVVYGVAISNNSATGRLVTLRFTTPPTKLNTQTLYFRFRKSWRRILTN